MLEQILTILDWDRGTLISTIAGVLAGGAINALFSWRGSKELRREAQSLRRETEKVRHYSRSTITWLKEAGLINPRVDPDTGEYLDIVGAQVKIQFTVEAAPEDTSKNDEDEEQPPA